MLPITTRAENASLLKELDCFLSDIPAIELAAKLAVNSTMNADAVRAMLDTYANESRVTVALIQHHLRPDMRILEVGAGLCLTSLFLKQQGYHITALEPATGGFDLFAQIKQTILQHYSHIELTVLDKTAQQLSANTDGCFTLVFSNNVMEHIPDWPAAIDAMTTVLAEDGLMLHACPNYTVPYEPHYGVPVFRHCIKLSKRLFLNKNRDDAIWLSLNFITCRNIINYCRKHALACEFERGLLYKSLKRIEDDPLFATRHQGMVAGIARLLMRTGLGQLMKHIPPCLATPMIMEIRKRKQH